MMTAPFQTLMLSAHAAEGTYGLMGDAWLCLRNMTPTAPTDQK
jgi:hypothetical protein